MQSLNSFAFNDIDGVRRTFVEGMPNPLTNDELKQLAKDSGGMVKFTAGASDQGKIEAYIQNKLGEKYDALYPEDFERAMVEADKEFQAFKNPVQQATVKETKKSYRKYTLLNVKQHFKTIVKEHVWLEQALLLYLMMR